MSDMTIKELLIRYIEKIAQTYHYDMLYETDDQDKLLIQIIKRALEGEIIGTPLNLHVMVDEETGIGEIVYYHSYGEFKRQRINIYEDGCLVGILNFIDDRLNWNKKR